jgi:hypothetical protein
VLDPTRNHGWSEDIRGDGNEETQGSIVQVRNLVRELWTTDYKPATAITPAPSIADRQVAFEDGEKKGYSQRDKQLRDEQLRAERRIKQNTRSEQVNLVLDQLRSVEDAVKQLGRLGADTHDLKQIAMQMQAIMIDLHLFNQRALAQAGDESLMSVEELKMRNNDRTVCFIEVPDLMLWSDFLSRKGVDFRKAVTLDLQVFVGFHRALVIDTVPGIPRALIVVIGISSNGEAYKRSYTAEELEHMVLVCDEQWGIPADIDPNLRTWAATGFRSGCKWAVYDLREIRNVQKGRYGPGSLTLPSRLEFQRY